MKTEEESPIAINIVCGVYIKYAEIIINKPKMYMYIVEKAAREAKPVIALNINNPEMSSTQASCRFREILSTLSAMRIKCAKA